MSYLKTLRSSAKDTGSIVCMGLDPVVEALPEKLKAGGVLGFLPFLTDILIEMKSQNVLPGAFKPNQGYFIAHDEPLSDNFEGSRALAGLIRLLFKEFPEIPVILDYKKGDIGKSSANYAKEGFKAWHADAVTVFPYMGSDSIQPFADYCAKGNGVYILNRTSNPGAKDIQDIGVAGIAGEFPLYLSVAAKIQTWARNNPGVGAVVGATSLNELSELAKVYAGKDIPLLIPGVGDQGGSANEVVKRLKDAGYDLPLARINSSSGITHPWAKKKEAAPSDYAEVCVAELDKLNREIQP